MTPSIPMRSTLTRFAARAMLPLLLAAPAWAEPVCADFLAAFGKKPPDLEFVGCEASKQYGLRALIANYRVPGGQARRVERHLMKRTGMAPLRFMCCGWDLQRTARQREGRIVRNGFAYNVHMHSEETLAKDWAQIPWFHVTVTAYLESP
jgi:hypothetical protein